jgi:hypothetical protein
MDAPRLSRRLAKTLSVALAATCLTAAGAAPSVAATGHGLSGSKVKPTQRRSVAAAKTQKKTAVAVAKSKAAQKAQERSSRPSIGNILPTSPQGSGSPTGSPGSVGGAPAPTGGSTPTAPSKPTEVVIPETPSSPEVPTQPETPSLSEAPVLPTEPTPPTSPTSPTQPSGKLLFNGAKISDFAMLQEAPNAITEVPNPLGGSESVLKMTVNNNDVAPITPTDNPRAQALSPEMLKPGEEFWLQTKFMIPKEMPSIPGWMTLVSIYGPPFNGPGPWDVEVANNELRWQRNANYDWDIPWRTPLVKGQWITVTMHTLLAANGWVEMWINGEQVKFFTKGAYNPMHEVETARLAMETMDASNNGGPNSARIMQYREAGMFQSGSVFFGGLKLGTTLASVQ